ncbi:MAG: hypothetical protein BWX80_00085 [Candidatus Hydrogenedentes bacterium ADurb.Bin101]|nr:MAG: hypothetical protein BWX80_00085 [Candidatus Hydrogenedentes bacterium ADurb.Bin101]
MVVAQVPGHQQPDNARIPVHHHAGIAARVAGIVPDHLLFTPGIAVVPGATEHNGDVATVTPGGLAPLTEGEHRPLLRDGQRGNAIRMVAMLALRVEGRTDGFGDAHRAFHCSEYGQEKEQIQCKRQFHNKHSSSVIMASAYQDTIPNDRATGYFVISPFLLRLYVCLPMPCEFPTTSGNLKLERPAAKSGTLSSSFCTMPPMSCRW